MEPFDLREWPGFTKSGGDPSLPAIIDQVAIDSRRIDSPASLFVSLKGAHQDGHQFVTHAARAGMRYALVNRAWTPPAELNPASLLRVNDPLKAFQEIAACYRKQQKATVIGVTGSYGKTMLKDLLQTLLSAHMPVMASPESFNSQIGAALSLFMIRKHHAAAIIEAGISQKGEMESLASMIAPNCSILTMIGDAHISTLKERSVIASEKAKLLSNTQWSLVPKDSLLEPYLPSLFYFWNTKDENLPYAVYTTKETSTQMPYQVVFPDGNRLDGVITAGFSYFLDLVNIAIKAAWLLKVPSETICKALKQYIPEEMRTEIWKSPTGATLINNTYCSDPQSVDLALKYLEQAPGHCRKIFIFGGMRGAKEHSAADYRRIGKAIDQAKIDMLFLYGKHPYGPLIEEAGRKGSTEIASFSTYEDALTQMRLRIHHDDMVLIKGANKESIDRLIEAFSDSLSNNQCTINLSSIKFNLEAFRSHLPSGTRIMPIIKALAYGTEDIRMAKFLASQGIDILGVSYVEEGVGLRRAGIKQPIFALNAAPYEAAKAVKWDLEVGVSDRLLIENLAREAAHLNRVIKVHLHVDTGMGRFGCSLEEALPLARLITQCDSLFLEGVMSHFACAEDPNEDAFTHLQIQRFESVIEELKENGISPPWKHIANSAGAARFHLPQYNMVRIGLSTYGLYSSETVQKALDLRLALSLTSRIVGINVCKKGDTVSYARSYQVTRDTQRIAVLPIGYFDGLHRNYSGKSHVLIRGQKAPMVGRICMDYMMVDVTDIPNAVVGDSVLIFGADEHGHYLSPEVLAGCGNSIVHELVTCLGPRIQRIFINEL